MSCVSLFFSFFCVFLSVSSPFPFSFPFPSVSSLGISIDGDFSDWANITGVADPVDNINGTVFQYSSYSPFADQPIPDCHSDDNQYNFTILPTHVYNPNVNIVEVKVSSDEDSLYYYIRVVDGGQIGKTVSSPNPSLMGRYYVIATIDIDDSRDTGYYLAEGGYYPNDNGFDGNIEAEFYNGNFNQAYYLDHSDNNMEQQNNTHDMNIQGIYEFSPSIYDYYTEYVYYDGILPEDDPQRLRCLHDLDGKKMGYHPLPPSYNGSLCFTQDMAPGPFQGLVKYALSPNGNEIEVSAPFRGFLRLADGTPTMGNDECQTLRISISLETSGEFSIPPVWVSDTSPTVTFQLGKNCPSPSFFHTLLGKVVIISVCAGSVVLFAFAVLCWRAKKTQNRHSNINAEREEEHVEKYQKLY